MCTFITHLKGYFKTMRDRDGVNELTALRLNIYITFLVTVANFYASQDEIHTKLFCTSYSSTRWDRRQ